ncbi:MAG: flavin reductase family protein [Ruminococcaceae bacterium]|nr:flavin reductase family protein [Oscillospiraceae bacterium]
MTDMFLGTDSLDKLEAGAFLTTKCGERINVMTIGWGGFCYIWRKPIFLALVRKSRFSYEGMDAVGEFTVSIPSGDMKNELAVCGKKSGRDTDKIAECSFELIPSETVSVPYLNIPGVHYECKTVYRFDMTAESVKSDICSKYNMGDPNDFHVLFFGEVLASKNI